MGKGRRDEPEPAGLLGLWASPLPRTGLHNLGWARLGQGAEAKSHGQASTELGVRTQDAGCSKGHVFHPEEVEQAPCQLPL